MTIFPAQYFERENMKKSSIVKILINLIAFPIPYRPLRRRIREALMGVAKDFSEKKFNDRSFLSKIRDNSILLVEPNDYHGVIIPGFVAYLREAGYNVDVLLRHGNVEDNPFARFEPEEMPRIYTGSPSFMRRKLRHRKIRQYQYVFLSSSYHRLHYIQKTYMKCLGYEPGGKNGLLLVEHDMGEHFKEAKEEKYLADNRLFTLIGQQKTRMLNPHYFGKVRRPQKNQKTNFIIVGQIIPAARDYISLINAVQSLAAMGKGDFIVTIIGEGQLNIDDSIAPFFDIKGCLDFSEMYREMEKADFICALLNPTCDFHKKYLNFVTPGALLLSFGFAKPMLIDHAFAEKYSLDDDTAIIYEGDGLLEAMLNAMKMPSDRYVAMGDAIVSLRNKIHDESLHNLKEALKLIEQG